MTAKKHRNIFVASALSPDAMLLAPERFAFDRDILWSGSRSGPCPGCLRSVVSPAARAGAGFRHKSLDRTVQCCVRQPRFWPVAPIWAPLPKRWEITEARHRALPATVCLVLRGKKKGLAVVDADTEPYWALVEGYAQLGLLPPLKLAHELELDAKDRGTSMADMRILSACKRTMSVAIHTSRARWIAIRDRLTAARKTTRASKRHAEQLAAARAKENDRRASQAIEGATVRQVSEDGRQEDEDADRPLP